MLITTRALVFSSLKYGEADLIVKCFTQKSGLKTYLVRGVLKSKKRKIKASLFQPLTQLELVANHRDQGKLDYLREARLGKAYESLHTDILKSTVVMFLSEVLKNSVKEEESNQSLYNFLEESLDWFDKQERSVNFHLLFLVKLTKFLGFYPDDSLSQASVFDLIEGRFLERRAHSDCVDDEHVNTLHKLLGINFDELYTIKLTQTGRSGFLLMLLRYYEIHLQGFYKPRSLVVLNEIYS